MGNPIKVLVKKAFYGIPASAVLMFHHVSSIPEIKKSNCVLDTNRFYSIINEHTGYASLFDVIEKPSKQKIAITFDDGLSDLYTIAYSFLKSQGIPFTAFIVTDFIDSPGYITTEQLKEMAADPLVTIGSHGVTHKILPSLTSEMKKNEFENSRNKLSALIGRPIEVFAYSHGQYDKDTLAIISGYRYAMSVKSFPLNFITKQKKYSLPRLNVEDACYDKVKQKIDTIIRR